MPCVPPTLDVLSKIINVTYEIVVTVCVSGPHYNPDVIIPITIGTMALVNPRHGMATALPSPSAPLLSTKNNVYPRTEKSETIDGYQVSGLYSTSNTQH